MNCERLEKNITDNILEAQIKLGYDKRPMSLNYTLASLNHILGTACDLQDMVNQLEKFAGHCTERLGKLSFREIKNGICITVPAEGTAYVNGMNTGSGFINELIETVREHGISEEDVFAVFRKYSDNVVIENSSSEEFDYLVYFPDGEPDEYRYCLALEPCMQGGCHITYHRFIAEDYADFEF